MGIYITTSKKSSPKTQILCKALSYLLPNSINERRGKKSIEQIFIRAKLLGKSRVMFIYEKDGIPSRICLMKVKAHSWEWVGEELLISEFHLHRMPSELPGELTVSGGRGEEFGRLLDVEKPEDEDSIEMKCGRKKLSFSYSGKPLLELELTQ